MEINPQTLDPQVMYKFMIGAIVPRPIGWISTVDEAGNPNLAPYSFFNAICAEPPHVLFCPGIRRTDMQTKDTLNNVQATGQFVVNIVTEDTAQAMNVTATELPPHVDEFELAGLTKAPSHIVKVPRVAESPIHFECELTQIITVSELPGGGSVVIGRVVHLHVDESVLIGTDKINLLALKPIGRLAGNAYSRVNDIFDLMRKPSQI